MLPFMLRKALQKTVVAPAPRSAIFGRRIGSVRRDCGYCVAANLSYGYGELAFHHPSTVLTATG